MYESTYASFYSDSFSAWVRGAWFVLLLFASRVDVDSIYFFVHQHVCRRGNGAKNHGARHCCIHTTKKRCVTCHLRRCGQGDGAAWAALSDTMSPSMHKSQCSAALTNRTCRPSSQSCSARPDTDLVALMPALPSYRERNEHTLATRCEKRTRRQRSRCQREPPRRRSP